MSTPTTVTWEYQVNQQVFVNGEARKRRITGLGVVSGQPYYKVDGYGSYVPEYKIKLIPPAKKTLTWNYQIGTRVFIGNNPRIYVISELVARDGEARYRLTGATYTQRERDIKPVNW